MISSTGAGIAILLITSFYYLKLKGEEKRSSVFWTKLLEEAFFVQKGLTNYVQSFFVNSSAQIFKRIEQNFLNQGLQFFTDQIFKLRTLFSFLQNGNLQSYALYSIMGLSILMFLIFFR